MDYSIIMEHTYQPYRVIAELLKTEDKTIHIPPALL